MYLNHVRRESPVHLPYGVVAFENDVVIVDR